MELDNFKYNLKKLKKCDQYWDEMDPVVGGRLCNKCDKTIVDFSNMTFSDIAFYMSERKEPVCGFYRPEQLNQISFTNRRLPIVASLTTLITTSTISKAEKISVQTEQHPLQRTHNQDANIEISTLNNNQKSDTIFLVGNVKYFNIEKGTNEPVSFASVIIKSSRNGTLTRENGDFKLRYLLTSDSGVIYLRITSIGLETKEIEIKLISPALCH